MKDFATTITQRGQLTIIIRFLTGDDAYRSSDLSVLIQRPRGAGDPGVVMSTWLARG